MDISNRLFTYTEVYKDSVNNTYIGFNGKRIIDKLTEEIDLNYFTISQDQLDEVTRQRRALGWKNVKDY